MDQGIGLYGAGCLRGVRQNGEYRQVEKHAASPFPMLSANPNQENAKKRPSDLGLPVSPLFSAGKEKYPAELA